MTARRLRLAGLEFRLTDIVTLYLSDMIIGIAAGILVILVAPLIERAWEDRPAPALGDLP